LYGNFKEKIENESCSHFCSFEAILLTLYSFSKNCSLLPPDTKTQTQTEDDTSYIGSKFAIFQQHVVESGKIKRENLLENCEPRKFSLPSALPIYLLPTRSSLFLGFNVASLFVAIAFVNLAGRVCFDS